jgi:hypothetical protein
MLFLEACTTVMWLSFGESGYVVGWVILYCNVGDEIKASSCCKKDGDVLVLMLRLEFVRRGFLVGLLIDESFSIPLTHCVVSKGVKKKCYLFHALMSCQLIA